MWVTGLFESVGPSREHEPIRTPRPFVPFNVRVRTPVTKRDVDQEILFLVDTGADSTLIEPADAYRLFGDELFSIDFDRRYDTRVSVGIGGHARSVIEYAQLSTISDDGDYVGVVLPICISEPVPRYPAKSGFSNWDAPSLLGRDVLSFFEVHLDYYPRPVVALKYDYEAYLRWWDHRGDSTL